MTRVLIIEDQSDIRRLIRWSLELESYEIHEAPDGEQGLRAAATLRPDVVLLDVMMPGALDGYEVCRRLKADAALQHAAIVMLTARAQSKDREAGERAGANAYLAKPFSPMELIDTIAGLLRNCQPLPDH